MKYFERIDSNEAESAEDEQAGDDFKCELCDFTSTWKGGFNIHIDRKHKLLSLDGGDFSSELNELDDCYEGSKHIIGRVDILVRDSKLL